MFLVDSIWDESKKILGNCDDDKLLKWIGDAVALIANKGDMEGFKGYVDVCTAGCGCVSSASRSTCNREGGCGRKVLTLPAEVDTVIGVNIGGQPAVGKAHLFAFHLNGPGDCRQTCEWSWMDLDKIYCTQRDLITPGTVVAFLQTEEDNDAELLIFGFDSQGNTLRRQVNGVWRNGYQVPTVFGTAVSDLGAPVIGRITGVQKSKTVAAIRLATVDDSGAAGVTLAVYQPDETLPNYRRIQLNRGCNWARVAYLKTNPTFSSRYDHIPLRSRRGFLMALQAVKFYSEQHVDMGHTFEADAARMELEAQMKAEAPVYFPPQILDHNSIRDKNDYYIV